MKILPLVYASIFQCIYCSLGYSAGEFLLPFQGPIVRESILQDPLCGLPEAVLPTQGYLDEFTFEKVKSFIIDTSRFGLSHSLSPFAKDQDLLHSNINLAAARGIDEAFFDRRKWRVVALRADLCEESSWSPDWTNATRGNVVTNFG